MDLNLSSIAVFNTIYNSQHFFLEPRGGLRECHSSVDFTIDFKLIYINLEFPFRWIFQLSEFIKAIYMLFLSLVSLKIT